MSNAPDALHKRCFIFFPATSDSLHVNEYIYMHYKLDYYFLVAAWLTTSTYIFALSYLKPGADFIANQKQTLSLMCRGKHT